MLHRYNFHKESQEDLEEFLKAAVQLQKDNVEKCSLINTYLSELQSQRQQQPEASEKSNEDESEEVIFISSQDDPKPDVIQNESTTQQWLEPDNFNFSVSADLTEIITENFLKEKTISQNELKRLVSSCSEEQLESFIIELKDQLDASAVCQFGMALSAYENDEDVRGIFQHFYKHIFFQLLSKEQSPIFQETFNALYKKFHGVIETGEIIKNLLHTSCSGIFLQNISKLDAEHKNEILRDLVLNCRQLEPTHLKALECLLDKNTHHSTIKMVIMLLAAQGETTDKALGKLIIFLMQTLGRNIHQFEQPLRQIIAKHRSVWKVKMQKVFDDNYECSQLSQSLMKH